MMRMENSKYVAKCKRFYILLFIPLKDILLFKGKAVTLQCDVNSMYSFNTYDHNNTKQ